MLATHILTHTFQHTLFDWLNSHGTHQIYTGSSRFGGTHVNFNQSKRMCWKVCVRMCVASISQK